MVSQSINTPTFMKPVGSLSCSQGHTSGPYPEPDASTPQLSTLFSQDPF